MGQTGPDMWWKNAVQAIRQAYTASSIPPMDIKAIGISYQMHGLVLLDRNNTVLRSSIIWCDSRAVETGTRAFESIGKKRCLDTMFNSPGNFTASKLKWVKIMNRIFSAGQQICLPGDYIALNLTGRSHHDDFGSFRRYPLGFPESKPPQIYSPLWSRPSLPSGDRSELRRPGRLSRRGHRNPGSASRHGTSVTYRAGDQPNNAFSLNVLEPGEVAATAGTSGVVYGIDRHDQSRTSSRVNTFAHVNHSKRQKGWGCCSALMEPVLPTHGHGRLPVIPTPRP